MALEWFNYVADISARLIALLFLFEGARRFALGGTSRVAVLMLGLGGFFCLAFGGMAYLKHTSLVDATKVLSRNVIASGLPLPDDWGTACCNDKRESSSHAMVRAAYLESGSLHTYFDASGIRKPYVPSQEDVNKREATVAQNAQIAISTEALLSEAVYWLFAGIFAPLLGIGIGRELRSMPANRTVEPDTRKNGARGSP